MCWQHVKRPITLFSTLAAIELAVILFRYLTSSPSGSRLLQLKSGLHLLVDFFNYLMHSGMELPVILALVIYLKNHLSGENSSWHYKTILSGLKFESCGRNCTLY
jgi:hypothetical protein